MRTNPHYREICDPRSYPPYFKVPEEITADKIDQSMDASRYLFVVVIPPEFESDVREGRSPEIQVNIDATAVRQAALGAGYIRAILAKEISRFANRNDTIAVSANQAGQT